MGLLLSLVRTVGAMESGAIAARGGRKLLLYNSYKRNREKTALFARLERPGPRLAHENPRRTAQFYPHGMCSGFWRDGGVATLFIGPPTL